MARKGTEVPRSFGPNGIIRLSIGCLAHRLMIYMTTTISVLPLWVANQEWRHHYIAIMAAAIQQPANGGHLSLQNE